MNAKLSQSVKEYALVSNKNRKHKKEKKYFSRLGFIVGKAPLYCQTETSKGPKKTISKLS